MTTIDELTDEGIIRSTYIKNDEAYSIFIELDSISEGKIYGDAGIEKTVRRKPGKNLISRLIAKKYPTKTEYTITTSTGKDGLYTHNPVKIEPGLSEVKTIIKERAQYFKIKIEDQILDKLLQNLEPTIQKIYRQITTN